MIVEAVLWPGVLRILRRLVEARDTLLVGVRCDLDELERRETARGDRRPGNARTQHQELYKEKQYDVEVDTTSGQLDGCVRAILETRDERTSSPRE